MKKYGLLYIILASVLWGTSGIFVHFLSPFGITSSQMTLIRSIVPLICIGTYIFFKNHSLLKTNPKELLLFLGSGASFFGTSIFYFYSMQLTSISTAVVLMYTAPIFVVIFSVLFLGEKLGKSKFIAIAGMIIGCALVSGIIGGIRFNAFGIIIGFLSGLSYASYNILTKIEMKKGINPLKANMYNFLFATLIGCAVSKPDGILPCLMINPAIAVSLAVGMGIVTSILPYFFYTLALREVPAGTASSLGILEPMSATIFSVLIFGENLSLPALAGIILILFSVFLLGRQSE